jgi:tRNA 2-thiouridine synthesizing protein E
MKTYTFNGKTFETDDQNFLVDYETWDKDFATGMAYELGMVAGLTERHWEIIQYIQKSFETTGRRPSLYDTCKAMELNAQRLRTLFPTGYLRGACLLAGVGYTETNRADALKIPDLRVEPPAKTGFVSKDKAYRIDIFGFLIDSEDWDEDYAVIRAYEMKIKSGLTPRHWQIIYFLRDSYRLNHIVPTIYECCEANDIDIEEMEALFPDGYHRCAVKLAGLPSIGVNIKRTIL